MNTQLGDLVIAYGVTAASMLVGLLSCAPISRAYWRWPVYSAMAMVLGRRVMESSGEAHAARRVDPGPSAHAVFLRAGSLFGAGNLRWGSCSVD